MKPLSYARKENFPPAASADPQRKYLAADTGMLYYISGTGTPTYKELWPVHTTPNNPIIGDRPRP